MKYILDPAFATLDLGPTPDELEALKHSIQVKGLTNPDVSAWRQDKSTALLIHGYRRWQAVEELNGEGPHPEKHFRVHFVECADRYDAMAERCRILAGQYQANSPMWRWLVAAEVFALSKGGPISGADSYAGELGRRHGVAFRRTSLSTLVLYARALRILDEVEPGLLRRALNGDENFTIEDIFKITPNTPKEKCTLILKGVRAGLHNRELHKWVVANDTQQSEPAPSCTFVPHAYTENDFVLELKGMADNLCHGVAALVSAHSEIADSIGQTAVKDTVAYIAEQLSRLEGM